MAWKAWLGQKVPEQRTHGTPGKLRWPRRKCQDRSSFCAIVRFWLCVEVRQRLIDGVHRGVDVWHVASEHGRLLASSRSIVTEGWLGIRRVAPVPVVSKVLSVS